MVSDQFQESSTMVKNILFLCTGNSARSIMAEAYFNHATQTDWCAYSAGSNPGGVVNPFAIRTLKEAGIPVDMPLSKSWDVFASPQSPQIDVVVTVCDNAANEVCPIWPGKPASFHWSFSDPAAVEGTNAEKSEAFRDIFMKIRLAIDTFLLEEHVDSK